MGETALVVVVPEAESAIELPRRRHTTSGAEGMPPHVTLIYPFTDAELLTADRVREVAEIVSRFETFDFHLTGTARFESTLPILYLAPEPAEPFHALIVALATAFPEHPPYGGVHAEPVPHVTVAVATDDELSAIESEVAARLPIAAHATSVSLMERSPAGKWRIRQQLWLAAVLAK